MSLRRKIFYAFFLSIAIYFICGSTKVFADDYQYALWFMNDLNISQVPGGDDSHFNTENFDVVGVTSNNIVAPFDCKIVAIYPVEERQGYGNTVVIQSKKPVHYADGSLEYMSMAFAHDDYIKDLYIGKEIKQGEVFYQTGTAGLASGRHSHVTCIRGQYMDDNEIYVKENNVWYEHRSFWWYNGVQYENRSPHNDIAPETALFISNKTNTNTYYGSHGLQFKNIDKALIINVNPNGKSKLNWTPVPGATTYSIAVGYTGKIICSTAETSYETVLDAGDYSLYMAAWNNRGELIMTSDLVAVSVPLTLKVDVNPNGKSKLSWNPVPGATTYSIAVGNVGKSIGHTTETSYETVLDVGDYSLYMAAWNGDKLIMTSNLVPVSNPLTLKVDVNPNGKSKLSWNPVPEATSYSIAIGYVGTMVCSTTETSYETVLAAGEYSLYLAVWNGDELIMTSALVPVSVPFTLVNEKLDPISLGNEKIEKGDINGDGIVNAKDLNMLYAHINGTKKLNEEQLLQADVTGEGEVTAKDLNRLYAHVNGTKPLN